jgi:hypothetical protein
MFGCETGHAKQRGNIINSGREILCNLESWSLGQGQRSQVSSTQIFCLKHFFPLIHPSHQISTKHLHSFRRYREEGNFGFKVTESRSKVAFTRFFRATHLCPLIHPPTKYQPKIFSRLRIIERNVNIMQFGVMVTGSRSKVTSTQSFFLTHFFPLIHPHNKYQPKIFIRLGDTERKGISV